MARITASANANGAKRSGGKFAVNPKSKRSIKAREKAAREAAERQHVQPIAQNIEELGDSFRVTPRDPVTFTAPPVATVETDGATVDNDTVHGAVSDEGESDSAAAQPPRGATVTDPTESYFAPPPEAPRVVIPDDIDDDDAPINGQQSTSTEDKKKNKKKRDGDKFFSSAAADGIGDVWSLYFNARHMAYLEDLAARSNNAAIKDLQDMGTLDPSEKKMIADCMREYLATTDMEMSPAGELAMVLTMTFLPRLLALEGTRIAIMREMKKQQRHA